ncbi:transcriptional activator protein Pur-alpha-like [Xenia sp. Carnegie-2017]|uniref:transcriptional activator protein Pur-alpha-like n=1 Tax=Xenia sp. Carnegie-2017 TaxID=2897299 RepID=UPI001F04197D|nr:transcriptional activator protein Pur-alpha-like [Xenia sp. Carnegie-2017]
MADDGERETQDEIGSHDGKGDARSDGAGRFSSYSDNKELTSKSLKIQTKVYYLDVKENRRGRFLKITEIPPNRVKSRVMIPMAFIHDVKDKLTAFAEYYASLDPAGEATGNDDQPGRTLKSDHLQRNNRRFHFDLRQNKRGYFLRFAQAMWNAGPNNSNKLAIPAQGIADIRNSLSEILDEFGMDEEEDEMNLPEAKEVRVEQKRFYFDVGSNIRGVFVRLSEVTNNYRACVTIPRRGWERIRDTLNELCDKCTEEEDERPGADYD